MIREQYTNISAIYDMLSEGDDGSIFFRHYLENILNSLAKGARVLDCSCGTGNHAIWLARQDFEVHASDISEGMISTSQAKAEEEGLSIKFFRSSWEELPEMTDNQYDLVVCPGNSLSHALSFEMLESALHAIRKITKPGGYFYFDIRNWEKTFEEANLETQDFQVEGKNKLYDVRYSYDIKGWNTQSTMFVDISPAGEGEYTQFSFDFLPFGYQQIHDILLKAGFSNVERGLFPGEEFYYAVAK